jgi:hypothetical protein
LPALLLSTAAEGRPALPRTDRSPACEGRATCWAGGYATDPYKRTCAFCRDFGAGGSVAHGLALLGLPAVRDGRLVLVGGLGLQLNLGPLRRLEPGRPAVGTSRRLPRTTPRTRSSEPSGSRTHWLRVGGSGSSSVLTSSTISSVPSTAKARTSRYGSMLTPTNRRIRDEMARGHKIRPSIRRTKWGPGAARERRVCGRDEAHGRWRSFETVRRFCSADLGEPMTKRACRCGNPAKK